MKISEFKTDENLEETGVWVDIDGTPDGTQLLVARLYNDNFNDLFDRKTKAHRSRIQRGKFPIAKQREIMRECMAETVLLDWKNLKDDAGKNIPYSRAKATEFLALRDFNELVTEIASTMETFRAEEKEKDTKNSEAS